MAGPEKIDPLLVWEAFLRTQDAIVRTLEREMMETDGLPLPWYDVLIQLYATPEKRLRMQVLAESVVLSRSGVTRLVDRLEREGLVRREASPEDRRGAYAALTEEGTRAYLKARPNHYQGIYEHFTRHLDTDDLLAMQTALTKLRDVI